MELDYKAHLLEPLAFALKRQMRYVCVCRIRVLEEWWRCIRRGGPLHGFLIIPDGILKRGPAPGERTANGNLMDGRQGIYMVNKAPLILCLDALAPHQNERHPASSSPSNNWSECRRK